MLKGLLMQPKTIAHFKTGIGNFVVITPALQAMASMDPSGKIDLCTDPVWTDYRKNSLISLWELLPFINKVYSVKEINHSFYDTWFWTNWTTHGESREIFQRHKNYEFPDWDFELEHESDYYMRLARDNYGYKGGKPKQCVIPKKSYLIDKSTNKLVLLCNGGFGEISVFKRWDAFDSFSKELKNFYPGVTIAKIGCKGELQGVQADLDCVDQFSLAETAGIIAQADLMITTDTGNMHIADALGTPTIVLWGGSNVPKNKPYENKNKVVHLGLPCQPCQMVGGYQSCIDLKCISDISIGEVMFYVRNFFNKGNFDG
jgi:ADP-heptose:LPS heptosyltransferase